MASHPSKMKRAKVYARQDGRCLFCGEYLKFSSLTLDHIKPKSRGGKNGLENLRGLCSECHQLRHILDSFGPLILLLFADAMARFNMEEMQQ